MSGRFSDGFTLKKMGNTKISINSQDSKLTRIISETSVSKFNEHVAAFEGQRIQGGEDVILKLRIQFVDFTLLLQLSLTIGNFQDGSRAHWTARGQGCHRQMGN